MHFGAPSTELVNDVDSRTKTVKVKKPKPSIGASNRIRSKLFRKKQRKRSCSSGKVKGPIIPETKREKKNPYIIMDGTNIDFSEVPSPICSCTGIARVCYRCGAGGWQSSCCTLRISEYPLPTSSTRPGARVAGRKMSNGAYMKLLMRLAAAGHDLSASVDLKDHWARHGTNNFVTIK
ncbi:protein BASIC PENTACYSTEINE7 [Pistacia vera]|uniref:protein BASIC PENTACYSTEINE7 n=1 Tax=Pistacia vera TaxID=55513 RepID=UPI001263B219|nr:protein BASIC PENTACYSTEINE7 [Pistacia vera]